MSVSGVHIHCVNVCMGYGQFCFPVYKVQSRLCIKYSRFGATLMAHIPVIPDDKLPS